MLEEPFRQSTVTACRQEVPRSKPRSDCCLVQTSVYVYILQNSNYLKTWKEPVCRREGVHNLQPRVQEHFGIRDIRSSNSPKTSKGQVLSLDQTIVVR